MCVRNLCMMVGLLFIIAPLAGCSEVTHKQLGLNKESPDEFQVISRPALIIPPNYDLRPPHEGSDYDARSASDDAKAILGTGRSRDNNFDSKKLSPAEAHFLDQAGTSEKVSGIRHMLKQDHLVKQKSQEGFWEKLKSFSPTSPHQPEPIVDAAEESSRVKEAIANKEAVNADDTPMLEKKRTLWDMLNGK